MLMSQCKFTAFPANSSFDLTTTPEWPWITSETNGVSFDCYEGCGLNTLTINIPKAVALMVRGDHALMTDVSRILMLVET
jgi:hypothetical protein